MSTLSKRYLRQADPELKSILTEVYAALGELLAVDGTAATSAIVAADLASLFAQMALKAPLASPHLTGIPTGPTADPGTSTTQLATTAFVGSSIAAGADTSGTFVPTATNLTAIGVVTLTGTYTQDGKEVKVRILITPSAGAISVATAGFIVGLPFVPATYGVVTAIDLTLNGLVGVSYIDHVTGELKLPDWPATTSTILLEASYETA